MSDYDQLAQDFAEGLGTPSGTPADAPGFQEIITARQSDFPVLKDGVQAISAALRAKFGNEFNLVTIWDPKSLELRQQGIAPGHFRLERRGQPDVTTPFTVSPMTLDFNGKSFVPGLDGAIVAELKDWAAPHFQPLENF